MDNEIFEQMMVFYAAPTLAGVKPASLISFKKSKFSDFDKVLLSYKNCFLCKGISFFCLQNTKEYSHILFYRKDAVENILNESLAKKILLSCGYPANSSIVYILNRLKENFRGKNFPHEIGLFLGYPPKDVKGFIEHKGRHFLISGYWKVYSNEKETQKIFDEYAFCTREFCSKLSAGAEFSKLLAAG